MKKMPGQNGTSKVSLYFVIQAKHSNEENTSEEMKLAFSNAVDWSLKPKWIQEEDICTIDCNSKGNVFVIEEFVGEFFNTFVVTYQHARVIGPKCLLTCFAEHIPIPRTQYPIYNLAMNGLLVTTSIKSAEEKKRITDLIGFMGGNCTDTLLKYTTHLVVSTVMSEKYLKANEENIPVLRSEWIQDLWRQSLVSDIKGTDEKLANKYKCSTFYKLNVTTSQLSESEKKKIKKIIEDNGGIYSAELQLNVTNLLIIPIGRGEKYKFAIRWKIKCVTPAWLEQSVTKKYAVRFDNFVVQCANKCSTPINSYNQSKVGTLLDTNDTDISVIPSENGRTVVSETANFDTQTQNELVQRIDANVFKTPVKNNSKNEKSNAFENPLSYQNILNSITINDIKKCQHLLDGCKVYLAGFNASEEDKLRRILKYGGAIRFTDLNESVTHVIVGNPNSAEIEALKSVANRPHIVKIDWLSSSISKGCLERENNCDFFNENNEPSNQNCVSSIQQPSPLSKKGMQMLNPVRQVPVNSHPIVGADQILIEKYASFQESGNDDVPFVNRTRNFVQNEQQQSVSVDKLFEGLRFAVVGHTTSAQETIKATLAEYGGTIVSTDNHSVVDYTIMPFTNTAMRITSTEVVTLLWIEECLFSEVIVETKYYHRPVTVSDETTKRALNDCVITLSSFNNFEKKYLENVARFLGAKCQEVLSKKQNMEKGISQTTHLICSRAEGVKYNAAKKWNLPVVTKDWLLSCLNSATKLPVNNYFVTGNVECNAPSISLSVKTTNKPEISPCVRPGHRSLASLAKTAGFPNATSSTKAPLTAVVASEVINHQSSTIHPNETASKTRNTLSSRLNAKTIPVQRSPVTTPSITEAVYRSTQRVAQFAKMNNSGLRIELSDLQSNEKNITNNKQSNRDEASAQKNWPTDLLLNINACASSSVKRKLHCQPSDAPETPQNLPRNKIMRYENQSSSPYEEVGWQDTLTDLSNVQADGGEKNVSSKPDTNEKEDCPATKKNNMTIHDDGDERRLEHNEVENNVAVKHTSVLKETITRPLRNNFGNFLISMPNSEKRTLYERIIIKLGGCVLPSFPTDCAESEKATHIIIDELKKTEKLLCSIASGIWVLHSSYLDRCVAAQQFLPEENFEWGNPLSEKLPTISSKDISSIARAAHRWRLTISKGGLPSRPFVGMKAVIIGTGATSDEVVHSLTRVVKSGGGSVLPNCDILSSTHCLLKSSKLELIPVPLKQLADRKIHCVPAVYLSDYLMNDPPPDIKTCYFEQYKRLFSVL